MRRATETEGWQFAQKLTLFFADGLPVEIADGVAQAAWAILRAAFGVGDQGGDAGGEGFGRIGRSRRYGRGASPGRRSPEVVETTARCMAMASSTFTLVPAETVVGTMTRLAST